jgi:hypothetical protein
MTKLDYVIMGIALGYISRPFMDAIVKIIKNSLKKD